jgi:hypothetical protein
VKSSDPNLLFIVALTEHRHLGSVFVPCLAELRHPCLEVNTILRDKDMGKYDFDFTGQEKEIVRLTSKISQTNLLARFSRNGTADEFFGPANTEHFRKQVIPFVGKQLFRVAQILMTSGIPLYKKESKYSRLYEEDLISVPKEYASVLFDFQRHAQGTDYRLRIFQNGLEIKVMNKNVHVITNDPCVFQISNYMYLKISGTKK